MYPWLIFEGPDCVGKTSLRLAYQKDRRARGLPELPASDRLFASCAVYPRLRGISHAVREETLRVMERSAGIGGAVYVFCYLPPGAIADRRRAAGHPSEWPVELELEEFDRWIDNAPLPNVYVNMEDPVEVLVLRLRALFEKVTP